MRTLLLALALPSTAMAAPMTLNHQGRLIDSSGMPLGGSHDLELRLYLDNTTSSSMWDESLIGVVFDNGYFSITLGESTPLDSRLLSSAEVWIGLAVDANPEISRQRVQSVPYAILADTATNLDGGVVDASEIRVGGNVVIDSSGNLAVEGSLGGLICANSGEVPIYDGSGWNCGALDLSQVASVPPDLLDGDADTLASLSCATPDALLAWDLAGSRWSCATPYGNADAITAMGTLDPTNPLNHDRYTNAEAIAAVGTHYSDLDALALIGDLDPANSLNHDRYTNAEAVAVVGPHVVQSGPGLQGDGSGTAPLGADWQQIPQSQVSIRFLEGEGPPLAATTGGNLADPSASGGMTRVGASTDAAGRVYGTHASNLGAPIAVRPAVVRMRMKVADNTSTSRLATMDCTMNDGSSWITLASVPIVPSSFPAADTWMELAMVCPWAPDDADQFMGVDSFVPGGTDLFIDSVSVDPLPSSTLDRLSCTDGAAPTWNAANNSWDCDAPVKTPGMYTLALSGSTSLDTAFSRDIYTCGASQVVHVEAAMTHWSVGYRAISDQIFYMDAYTGLSSDVMIDQGTALAGSWSFQRIVTGNNGYGDTSDRLRITHKAGTYGGGANYYIFVRSTCPIREL